MATEKTGILETGKPGELRINGKLHKAILYPIDGNEVELYRIGALADALEKTPQLIVKWEKAKLFPKPLYRVSGTGFGNCKRLYSKEQLINVRRAWKVYPLRKGAYKFKNDFFRLVHTVFYKMNTVTITPKTENHGEQNNHV